jgi:hypothetical protein
MLPFIIIFLIAGFGLVMVGRNLELRARQSAGWPTVAGMLEYCEVVEVPGIQIEDVSTWQLRIRYSYVVRGTKYHSTQYAFGYGDGWDDSKHRAVADALRSQSELLVHYDPKRPSEAVISTQAQTNITALGYSILAVAGVAAIIWIGGR